MTDLLAEGFVIEDQCEFTFLPSVILLQGTIVCLDGLTVEVEKEIAVLSGRGMTALIQTRKFRYHAWIRSIHNILRYESAHDHRPHPHKHLYATFGDGRETQVVDLLDEGSIPTLGEFIRGLQYWHQENATRFAALR